MSTIRVLPNCQISENYDVGYRVTNERMNERDSLGLFSANRRETKKSENSNARIFGKIGMYVRTYVRIENKPSRGVSRLPTVFLTKKLSKYRLKT